MSYSPQVLDHFAHPRHAGELFQASAVAEASNPVCGDVIKLWVRAEQGWITGASFKAAGCVPAVACGSWLVEWISSSRSLEQAGALTSEDVEAGLAGLPAASKHAAQLAIEVLHKTLAALSRASAAR
jgi:nitrogen fixation protein NifU and related proteins